MVTQYASKRRVAFSNVLDGIGDTPLAPVEGIYCKLEYLNPSGSIKARIAKYMIEKAEKEGLLKPGDTIVEASSGNTGNALSMVAAAEASGTLRPGGVIVEATAGNTGLGLALVAAARGYRGLHQ